MTESKKTRKPRPVLAAVLACLVTPFAMAQNDGSSIILPLEAQTCNLPSAPARIPVDVEYDGLIRAKKNVADFQAAMVEYRDCLDKTKEVDMLTDGNRIALVEAHNYSVEMEERIAEQFNDAVRGYKERQAAAKQP